MPKKTKKKKSFLWVFGLFFPFALEPTYKKPKQETGHQYLVNGFKK